MPAPGGRILSRVFARGALSQTRPSFASAWLRLGGTLLDFQESPYRPNGDHYGSDEPAELCSNYTNIAVLRTADSDSLEAMVDYFRVPVINAGNGDDEHPTNAMPQRGPTTYAWSVLQHHGEAIPVDRRGI